MPNPPNNTLSVNFRIRLCFEAGVLNSFLRAREREPMDGMKQDCGMGSGLSLCILIGDI